ncbi:MAG: protein kinase [Terriglobia bacterium]
MKSCPTCQAGYPTHFAVCPQDGTPLVEYGEWPEGTIIRGKYRILQKIGQGGMGAVYKALHVTFDELRAIKVISPDLVNDQMFLKRFKHEAVITRKLQHPNAVRVDDIDESEDGRPFIVMEFIEGRSLRKLIEEEGAMPSPRVCSIIKQVAAGLEAAHRLGMVHRDIKPDNIVLIPAAEGETAKVLDFGIAKIKESRRSDAAGMTLTGTGVVIGTPQYMSPEQAMGKRGDELDGRSDLYSLGIVMYQMLTGDLPYKADTTMAMILAHLQARPTPIRSVRPDLQVPDSIAAVVMRLLEKQPDMRPASAGALIAEIEQAEAETISPRETLRSLPENVYSPHAAAGALQSALRGEPRREPPQPPASPPHPPEIPVAEPRPARAAEPARQPVAAPRPAAVLAPPARRSSQWGIWVAVAILVAGLAGGGWYISSRTAAPEPQPQTGAPASAAPASEAGSPPAPSTENTTTPSEPVAAQPEPTQPPKEAQVEPATPSQRPAPVRMARPEPTVETPSRPRIPIARRPEPQTPSIDPKQISAAIKMGDFFFERGEYDSALGEYQRGLGLDPTNQVLRAKILRTRRAKAAEESLNR